MKRTALALPLLLFAAGASAQEVPPQTRMDLWCGIAFRIVTADAPTDTTPEQEALIRRHAEGGERLVEAAKAVYLEQGTSEAAFSALVDSTMVTVLRELTGADPSREYSFEDCAALL